jgi:hypothetical protein
VVSDETNEAKPRGPLAAAHKRIEELEAALAEANGRGASIVSPAPVQPLSLGEFAAITIGPLVMAQPGLGLADADNPYGTTIGLSNAVYSLWRSYLSMCDTGDADVLNAFAFQEHILGAKRREVERWAAQQAAKMAREREEEIKREIAKRTEDHRALMAQVELQRQPA